VIHYWGKKFTFCLPQKYQVKRNGRPTNTSHADEYDKGPKGAAKPGKGLKGGGRSIGTGYETKKAAAEECQCRSCEAYNGGGGESTTCSR